MHISELQAKEQSLVKSIQELGSVVVAYSGGVDSSLLAYYARRYLNEQAIIAIAVSESLAEDELKAARLQAQQFKWNLLELNTTETSRDDYQRNDAARCYICKGVLFERLWQLATECGVKNIAYGANMDDMRDFRPGHKAAEEHSVLSPLQACGLSKEDIRTLAQQAGLPSWDRPQAACLSSRFPTFEPVTVDGLKQVELAERYVHQLGFRQVRVRHYGSTARVEVGSDEVQSLLSDQNLQEQISSQLKALGYLQVEFDPQGYKQGSANRLDLLKTGGK